MVFYKSTLSPLCQKLCQKTRNCKSCVFTRVRIKKLLEKFNDRIDHEVQKPKIADKWPVENLWSVIKTDVAKDHVNSRQDLK